MEDYYTEYDYEDDGEPEYAEYYEYENYETLMKESMADDEEELEPYQSINFQELFKYCMVPTAQDSYAHLFGILLWPFLFLLASKLPSLPRSIIHLLSALFGCYYMWQMFDWKLSFLFGLLGISYVALLIAHFALKKYRGVVSLFCGVLYLVMCELKLVEAPVWHTIRGLQMIVLMKMTSVGFDLDSTKIKSFPSFVEILGYVFHPGTVLFGPWISFASYKEILLPMKWTFKWILKICSKLLAGVIFLLVSTCVLHWLIPDTAPRFPLSYRDALSFRTSHYFVSYLSEVSSSLSGVEVGSVSRPFHIEFPRSLVEVVVCWNAPMHHWLKTYVFKTARGSIGMVPALTLTYAVSALFHGLNFQLASVLLSLSFYTYTEYTLRMKLADTFSACIESRKCIKCEHKFQDTSVLCRVLNAIFGLLTMYHLAYLGMMFDSTPKLHEAGYNMLHTLKKWGQLGYSSHWLALISYVIMSVL